eukprot:TRINITY_DN24670_c0_g1_i2.p1 TRINITY_DN24670_c0_g1~~TRINITY_DN24670_c0_g1_i2.p1  ORF type:complete len:284 (+),score=63.31 TRINITY_DN24670_c0_g1_i2:67-918(+)
MPGESGPDAGAAVEEVSSFSFEIPEGVQAGVTLKVTAPDNVQLHIPVSANVQGGDKMVMVKGAEGKWGIKHIVRAAETPAPSVPTPAGAAAGAAGAPALQTKTAEDIVCRAALKTTKGTIHMQIVPSWAPKGSQRFLQLITDKYYTDLAIYRAVPGFLVQFGVTSDTARVTKYEAIPDDELRGVPITEGMVCFAASGANTRTATICIFLHDFPQLGKKPWETPIGKVTDESLAVLRSIYTGYGDMPQCGGNGPDPIQLQDRGNSYILEEFPNIDFVESASWEC